MVENKNSEHDVEQSDVFSNCSSINLDEIGENGLIRKYRRADINKKKEQAKDLSLDEVQEM